MDNKNEKSLYHEYHLTDDRLQEPSAMPTQPQFNDQYSGCNCAHRGFIGGRGGQSEDQGTTPAIERAFSEGEEGVESHMLADEEAQYQPTQLEEFYVPTGHAEYRFDRNGFTIVLGIRMDDGEQLQLRRIDSESSIFMHPGTVGDMSIVSSELISKRPESPAHMVQGAGTWTNSIANIRSGYFFHTVPLPLVAPVKCCSCRSAASTESNHDSSATLFSTGSSEAYSFTEEDSEEEFNG